MSKTRIAFQDYLKRILLVGCLLICVLGMTACAKIPENAELKEKTTYMLDALLTGAYDEAYVQVQDVISEEEFEEAYDQLQEVLDGVDTYELEQVKIHTYKNGDVTQTQVVYRMKTNKVDMVVTVTESTEYEGLAGFYINYETKSIGTVTTMKEANAFQWLMLVFAGLETAFVIWMVVDCARRRMKHKVGWMIAILLGMFTVLFTIVSGRVSLYFNLSSLVGYSAFITYTTGGFTLRVLFPVGAIVYLCRRKHITIIPKQQMQDQQIQAQKMQEQQVQEVAETEQ